MTIAKLICRLAAIMFTDVILFNVISELPDVATHFGTNTYQKRPMRTII